MVYKDNSYDFLGILDGRPTRALRILNLHLQSPMYYIR